MLLVVGKGKGENKMANKAKTGSQYRARAKKYDKAKKELANKHRTFLMGKTKKKPKHPLDKFFALS